MTDPFAHRAAEWDTPEKIKMTEKFVAEILKHIQPQKEWKALEIGAGTGLVGMQLEQLVDRVVFEDTSAAMLEVLTQKLDKSSKSKPFLGVITDYSETDIDFAFSCMAFHHIPDTEGLLKHLAAICKHEAYVVIADLMTEDGSFHHFEAIPHQGFDLSVLSQLFSQFGFEVLVAHCYNVLKKKMLDGSISNFDQFILVAKKVK